MYIIFYYVYNALSQGGPTFLSSRAENNFPLVSRAKKDSCPYYLKNNTNCLIFINKYSEKTKYHIRRADINVIVIRMDKFIVQLRTLYLFL
jgi:hypothetical protein